MKNSMKLLSLVPNLFRPLLCKGGHDAAPEYIGISVIGFRCHKCQYKWYEARNARWNGNPWDGLIQRWGCSYIPKLDGEK